MMRTAFAVIFIGVGLYFATPASIAAPQEPVFSLVQREKPAVIHTLQEIVSIESGSQDKAGLDLLSEWLSVRLKLLGAETEFIDANSEKVELNDTPKQVGRIVAGRFEGTGTRRIMLLAQMDTV